MHRPPQLLIRDIEITLCGLQVCVAEQQLNRAEVQTFGQPSAGRLVPEVVPMEIDLGEMLAIHAAVRARARRLDTVSDQYERLPGRADRALILASRGAEHVCLRAEESTSLQQLRQTSLRLERNASRFGVLRVLGGDDDLVRVPQGAGSES